MFEITDPAVSLDTKMAVNLLSELTRLLPDEKYLRVTHTPSRTVACADYELGVGLWVNPDTDEEVEFEPPGAASRLWDQAVDRLQALAA